MGALNLSSDQSHLPEPLNSGLCPICHEGELHGVIGDAGRSSFDYYCNVCNPEVLTSITDFLIMDQLFVELRNNEIARREIQSNIRDLTEKEFSLNINTAAYFLGEADTRVSSECTFDDWMQGRIWGNPKHLTKISLSERQKILEWQKEEITRRVDKRLERMKQNFQTRNRNSLNSQALLQSEIETFQLLFDSERAKSMIRRKAMNDKINLGNLTLTVDHILGLQKFYRMAVNGELDTSVVPSPAQKFHFASDRVAVEYMVNCLTYSDYLEYLKLEYAEMEEIDPKGTLKKFEFDIALSYAGENRDYVKKVAEHLDKEGVSTFYDEMQTAQLWGKNLFQHLNDIYKNRARYCIVFVSQHYAKKAWPQHELKSAQARAFKENREYILPVRFDDTELPGMDDTTSYLSGQQLSPVEVAQIAIDKLGGP